MNCTDVRARLHVYVDGELAAAEVAAADAHCMACPVCADLIRREREFQSLLRRQPRDAAPPELRARILAALGREHRARPTTRWSFAAVTLVVAAVVVMVTLSRSREPIPLISELIAKHIAYAQVEQPAELASTDGAAVAEWLRSRAGLGVAVPDFSPSGIRLIGARLADAREREVAYLLYEKGRTLLSVFIVPISRGAGHVPGRVVSYRGYDYAAYEEKGFRSVSWTEGRTLYGLVSMLDYDALLECADRLHRTNNGIRL